MEFRFFFNPSIPSSFPFRVRRTQDWGGQEELNQIWVVVIPFWGGLLPIFCQEGSSFLGFPIKVPNLVTFGGSFYFSKPPLRALIWGVYSLFGPTLGFGDFSFSL